MLFLRSHRQYVGGENKTLRTIKLFKSTQSTILKLQNITKATVFRKIQVYHRLNKMTDSQMRRFIQSESEFIWMWFIIERSLMCLLSWYIFALRVVTDSLLSSLIHHKGMRALSNCSLSPSWQIAQLNTSDYFCKKREILHFHTHTSRLDEGGQVCDNAQFVSNAFQILKGVWNLKP